MSPLGNNTLVFCRLWLGACVCAWLWGPVQAAAPELARSLMEQARALEHGEGVERDPAQAAALYCQAAKLGNPDAQYALGWMYANARGVERDDAVAVYLFRAAAEQGIAVAPRMLSLLGPGEPRMPDCMRTAEPAPAPEPAPVLQAVAPQAPVDYALIAPKNIYDLVHKLSPRFSVEPQLALAIIAAESNFDSLAVSPKNARGLMQLVPETSKRFNVINAFDPAQNIRGGLSYLRWLLAYFEGDVTLVAAAYNAGEGTVERYRGVPPFPETLDYVQRVLHNFGAAHHSFEPSVTRPSVLLGR